MVNHGGHSDKGIIIGYYYDKKTKLTIDPHTKTDGFLGLGSEAGWLTSKISEEKDKFTHFLEAEVYTHVDSEESFDLRNGSSFLRSLSLTGEKDIDGSGNKKDNTLIGNSGNNKLKGFKGNDTFTGGAGNDIIDGVPTEQTLRSSAED